MQIKMGICEKKHEYLHMSKKSSTFALAKVLEN